MTMPMSYASTVAAPPPAPGSISSSSGYGTSPSNPFPVPSLPPTSSNHGPSGSISGPGGLNYSPPTAFTSLGGAGMGMGAVNPHATTRILQLTDFSKDLKTRDIQLVFSEWEDERGGFKIKWVDDTSCLIVFADASVAKRAFLSTLSNLPPSLSNPPGGTTHTLAKLRPYNGPEVTHILTSVQNRPRSRSNASTAVHSRTNSNASVAGGGGLRSQASIGNLRHRVNGSVGGGGGPIVGSGVGVAAGRGGSLAQAQVQELIDDITANAPPVPSMPGGTTSFAGSRGPTPTPPSRSSSGAGSVTAPDHMGGPGGVTIGDAGKRFIAAGLGKPGAAAGLVINGHSRTGSESSQTDFQPPSSYHPALTLPESTFQPFSLRFRSDSHASTVSMTGSLHDSSGGAGGLNAGVTGGLAGMTIEELPEVATPRAPTHAAAMASSGA